MRVNVATEAAATRMLFTSHSIDDVPGAKFGTACTYVTNKEDGVRIQVTS
jgi:hypothetical protein